MSVFRLIYNPTRPRFTILVSTLLISSSLIALAAIIKTPQLIEKQASETTVYNSHSTFITAARRYLSASTSEQAGITTSLQLLAIQRKQLLIEEIQKHPEALLANSIASEIRVGLPETVQSQLEVPQEITGILTVIHVDNLTDRKSHDEYFLQSGSQRFRLHFTDNPPKLPTGSTIKVQGLSLDSNLVVQSETPLNTPIPIISGEQKTLVMMVDFTNTSPPDFLTKSEVWGLMFTNENSVNRYYQETSYGKINFSGDVLDWFEIPFDNTNCDSRYWIWSDAADQQVINRGIDLSAYQRLVYVFSQLDNCGYAAALGTVGGYPSRSWMLGPHGRINTDIYAHELGHNLGTRHANDINCGTLSIDDYSRCTSYEYGDPFDVMGGANNYNQFNAPHKLMVGWLTNAKVQNVTADGRYEISPLETSSNNFQALRIRKTDSDEDYLVEYRRQYGFDSNLPAEGALVHIWNNYPYEKTNLIDHNLTDTGKRPFNDGECFYDHLNSIMVRQLAHSSTSATIEISFSNTCPTPSPTPTPSPPPYPTLNLLEKWEAQPSISVKSPTITIAENMVVSTGGLTDSYGITAATAYATVDSSGVASSWSNGPPLPLPLYSHAMASWKNKIYVIGGSSQGQVQDQVYLTTVTSAGISSWKGASSLPQPRFYPATAVSGNTLYVLGGEDSAHKAQANVYMARISDTGELGPWTTAALLPSPLIYHSVIAYQNYLYLLGGFDGQGKLQTSIYRASINSDSSLGPWQLANQALPQPLNLPAVTVDGNYLLILGGGYSSKPTADIFVANFNPDGTLSPWSISSVPLPKPLSQHTGLISGQHLFIGEGVDDRDHSKSVYTAKLLLTSIPPTPTPTPLANRKPVISTSSLPDGTLGTAYQIAIRGFDRGASANDTLTMTASGLPRGLNMDSAKCKITPNDTRLNIRCNISGRPKESGDFQVRLVLTDIQGSKTSKTLPLIIQANQPPPSPSSPD